MPHNWQLPRWAKKPEKIELSAFGSIGSYSEPDYWISGNIIHGRGATHNGMAIISWQTPFVFPSFPGADPSKYLFTQTSEWIVNYDVNLETGKGNMHYTIKITLDDGTFEGTSNLHGTFTEPSASHHVQLVDGFRQGVFHGTGAYQGWKIVVSGPTVDGHWEPEMYLFR